MFSFNNHSVFVLVGVAVAFALSVSVSAQTTPPSQACNRTYTIQPGDSCDSISAGQNVSTYQLATANSGVINPTCSNLVVGETICLGLVGNDCTLVHAVVAGDTCATVARAAGISTATLLSNNPNVNAACSNIYGGEVLCVAPATAAA